MIYRNTYLQGFLAIAILFLTSCGHKTTPPATTVVTPKGFHAATIMNFKGRDGCDFALQLETGENLEPAELPKEYQVDQMKVWVRYRERKGIVSICMIGKSVQVLEIKKR